MAVQTWVARFVVDHGQVTEEGGHLRTFPRRRLDEPDADLHVLAEPTGPNSADFGAQALDAIGRLFLKENLSLTGGLVRSLRGTHQTLVDWNRRSVAKEQVGVGIVAAAVRGNSVFLCQVGPTLVYVKQGGVLERLKGEPETAEPLGVGEFEPLVRHIELAPGDLVLAGSLSLESRIDAEMLDALLARGAEEALPEIYLLTRDLETFALFAVSCADDGAEATGDPATDREEPPPPPSPIEDRPPPSLAFESPPPEEESAPALVLAPRPLDISRPVVSLRSDAMSSRNNYARTTGASRVRFDLQLPRFFAFGVAAIVLGFLAFTIVPDLVHQNRAGRVASLVDNAQGELTAARSETDPGHRRTMLDDVKRQAGEALRLDPSSADANALYGAATASLQAADAITTVTPTTVATLSKQVTGDVLVDRVVIAGSSAYLLDSRGRRILALPLAGGANATAVFEDGGAYGGTPGRAPQAMTWDEQGGRLLILDSERKLFELRPGGTPQPLVLRKSASWASATAISAFDGNLYVLDARGKTVFKYLPAASGFDSEPLAIVNGAPGLSGATALAVNKDVYVLADDGKVHRFTDGAETGFPLGGIDRALLSPRSLTGPTAQGLVYIADTGNKRVVVAGADGNFSRQLVSNSFADLRAIALDPAGATLYVVAGDALYSVPLGS